MQPHLPSFSHPAHFCLRFPLPLLRRHRSLTQLYPSASYYLLLLCSHPRLIKARSFCAGSEALLPITLSRPPPRSISSWFFGSVAEILGGGFPLGSLVMIMEDAEAPHHMLFLRNFMSQGLVHKQPLLYASPATDPRAFLGTLPNPVSLKDDRPRDLSTKQEKNLRIAWQYKKYFDDPHQNSGRPVGKFNPGSSLQVHSILPALFPADIIKQGEKECYFMGLKEKKFLV